MNEAKTAQPGSLLLPPASNWFLSGSVDSREEDRLLAVGAFRNIVIYRIPVETEAPTVLKSIYHSGCKVLHVRLYPEAGHQEFGSSLLATSDQGSVTLFNIESGVATLQHNEHGAGGVNGVCWNTPSSSNEVTAVSVGAAGTIVVWNVSHNITRKVYVNPSHRSNVLFTPQPDVTLTLVEPVPGEGDTVAVAAQKVILIVDIKNGRVLSHLRGHDQPVYCLRWWSPSHAGSSSPFSEPRPANDRAEAFRDATMSGPEAAAALVKEAKNSSGTQSRYFASSDLGGSVFLWDVERRRYVYKTQVSGQAKGGGGAGGGRSYRPATLHCALAWHGDRLLTNTVTGAVVTLPLSENTATSVSTSHENSSNHSWKGSNDWRNETGSWRNKSVSDKKQQASENNMDNKSKVVHKEHSRVVFNLNVIGSTLVSCGHDRNLIGYCLDTNKVHFCLPTLGGAVHSIAFDPRDSSWLALGLQENCIRLIKLNSSPPLRSKVISNGIKGKVQTLSWHPKEDGFLLYGTSDGQVGITNVNTGKVTTFSFFHQKPVYKVEWASAVLPDVYPDYAKSLCAYSFGDREIAMRNASTPMADPIKLSKNFGLPTNPSEFSFSQDYEYLTIGCQDGSISVYRTSDLAPLVKIAVVRKTILHLLWKPTVSDGAERNKSYILAVSSSDNKICLLDLTSTLPEQSKKADDSTLAFAKKISCTNGESSGDDTSLPSWQPLIVSTCTRELCGHSSRVVYMSFSMCEPHLLASASYDHTCQVWDSNSGEQLGNYRGHLSRLYRVEFSPSEPGLLFSIGEENCLHRWNLADLKEKSPPEKILKIKESKPVMAVGCESEEKREVAPVKSLTKSDVKPRNSKHTETNSFVSTSKRTPTHKSLFPLLHKASCHKRSFYLLSLMCLYEQARLEEQQSKRSEQLSIEEMLEAAEEDGRSSSQEAERLGSASVHYRTALDALGDAVFEADDPVPPKEDLEIFVDFYGSADRTAEFLEKQIKSHMESNISAAAPLHLWRGTSEPLVRHAISTKTVTADVVVQAMHFSRQLGEVACEAYANQLAAAGDFLPASSYLVMANKVTEAIELLQHHKLYREALVLAKTRRPCSRDLHRNITRNIANNSLHEGNFDLAAVMLASLGDASEAADVLCRRGDPVSLTVGGMMYLREGHALAGASLLEALRTAGYRGQLDKILPEVLRVAPEYRWFSLIAITIREVTALVAGAKQALGIEDTTVPAKLRSSSPPESRSSSQDPAEKGKLEPSDASSSVGDTEEDASRVVTPTMDEGSVDARHRLNGSNRTSPQIGTEDSCVQETVELDSSRAFFVSTAEGEMQDVLQRITGLWQAEIEPSSLASCHATICSALSASLQPTTLKQYVFLVCVEITKMLLCLSRTPAAAVQEPISASVEQTQQQEQDQKQERQQQQSENVLDVEGAASALRSALQLAVDWRRFEQLFEITHMLLPEGIDHPPEVLAPLFRCRTESVPNESAVLLCKLYSLTDCLRRAKCSPATSVSSEEVPKNTNHPKTSRQSESSLLKDSDTVLTGDDSSEVNSSVSTSICDKVSSKSKVASVSHESEVGKSCREEMILIAKEVAENCAAGDETKAKRIFIDISTLLDKFIL